MEFDDIDSSVLKIQGNVGVAKAIYEYSKRGYTVLLPFSDSDKYDLVVDIDSKLYKVQVKTSRNKRKNIKSKVSYEVNLATRGGNSKKNIIRVRREEDYDILFCLIETGECWSIPVIELGTAKYSFIVTTPKFDKFKL